MNYVSKFRCVYYLMARGTGQGCVIGKNKIAVNNNSRYGFNYSANYPIIKKLNRRWDI